MYIHMCVERNASVNKLKDEAEETQSISDGTFFHQVKLIHARKEAKHEH
jgi:hypothetical protein